MKFTLALILLLSVAFSPAFGADIVNNPDQPLKKNTGKGLRLTGLMQIHDLEGSYYFKNPTNIKISSNGCIFLSDEEQLLKFDANGKFCKNFYKHGQGPMETTFIRNYLLEGEKLIIHDSGQNKVVIINHDTGEPIREFRMQVSTFSSLELFHNYNKGLYFLENNTVDTGGKLEIIDVEKNLLVLSADGNKLDKRISFPQKYFAVRTGENYFIRGLSNFVSCLVGDDLLYISHTPEYLISLYSFKTNGIIRQITREYSRVKVTDENRKYAPGGSFGKISIGGDRWYKLPVPDYHLDIQALFYHKNKLWVVTSTNVIYKGGTRVLVDVYDSNGVYEDAFYLDCPAYVIPFRIKEWLQTIDGDFLYTIEEDNRGERLVKKYKIEGWN